MVLAVLVLVVGNKEPRRGFCGSVVLVALVLVVENKEHRRGFCGSVALAI